MKKVLKFIWSILLVLSVLCTYALGISMWKTRSLSFFFSSVSFWIVAIIVLTLSLVIISKVYKSKIGYFFVSICIMLGLACSLFFYFPFVCPSFLSRIYIENYHVQEPLKTSSSWPKDIVVAHSMGSIDGLMRIQSPETFKESYQKGYRVLEVDFTFTKDKQLVCRHLWEDPELQKGIDEAHIPTLEQFKRTKLKGKYTPLSFEDLCLLLKQYKDVWIITDTKDVDLEEVRSHFSSMIQVAQKVDALDVLDRFVVQLYTKEMYSCVQEIYPFKNNIFATYVHWNGDLVSFKKYCEWCNKENIDTISMWEIYHCPIIQSIADAYNLDVYVHTPNEIQVAQKSLDKGAKGIYSDLITEKDVHR